MAINEELLDRLRATVSKGNEQRDKDELTRKNTLAEIARIGEVLNGVEYNIVYQIDSAAKLRWARDKNGKWAFGLWTTVFASDDGDWFADEERSARDIEKFMQHAIEEILKRGTGKEEGE